MSERIKLVATDMDGTLLDSNKKMPRDFKPWVLSHPEILTVIASGRQYYALKRDFEDIEDNLLFIAENGGLVFEKNKVIHCDEFSPDNVRACFEIFNKLDNVAPVICGVESAYMINPSEAHLQNAGMYYARLKIVGNLDEVLGRDTIVKLALYVDNFKAADNMKFFEGLTERMDVVLSGVSWIDFANYSANKGNALKSIMEKYGIHRREAMAFGDYYNDISLLESVDESYCMANGHEDIKAITKYIAKSNDEDGVMEVLREIK